MEQTIKFLIILVISLLIVMTILYNILINKTKNKKVKVIKNNKKVINDYNSANAKLFGLTNEDDLENTKVFQPIDEEYLKKHYNVTNVFEIDNELPKLKK